LFQSLISRSPLASIDRLHLELDPRVDFLAGTIAGMAALIVGYPFDTIKVRFQDPVIRKKYPSVVGAFTTIVREERVFGLFKGITSPMVALLVIQEKIY
jgi:solute carrier family 25 carnitine/acylcarnitine transporter 20/29